MWPIFHEILDLRASSVPSLNQSSWISPLKRRTVLFVHFVKEWVEHINSVKGTAEINWFSLEGYNELVQGFLYHLRTTKIFSRHTFECTITLLTCDKSLINFFIKSLFLKTNVHNLPAVNGLLNY
eukprot:TRINITY_DN10622_c0_g1_i1.p1 TRINITY_DN10622_c0_g1~~TRINITY_DN10622_c0_g1_i1.p1  ORF type:complete len:125 (+),score=9.64 TRINITY_DN10622_c0_g1_i1:27-401(+)